MDLFNYLQTGRSVEDIEGLLKCGLDVSYKDEQDKNALHVLVDCFRYYNRKERLQVLNLLITYGAGVNIQCKYGLTVLMRLLGSKGIFDSDFIQCLLDNNADVNLVTEWGTSVLHYFPRNKATNEQALFRTFLEKCYDINITNKSGETPLMAFVREVNDVEQIKNLIEAGADVQCRDVLGNSVLHICSTKLSLHPEEIKILIDHGADINAKNKDGATPLIKCIQCFCDQNSIMALLKKGANVFDTDFFSDGVLHYLRFKNNSDLNIDAVKLLLDYGARPNLKNMDDETPLLIFLKFNFDISFIELLFMNGACLNYENEYEMSIVHLYYRHFHTSIPIEKPNNMICKYMLLYDETVSKWLVLLKKLEKQFTMVESPDDLFYGTFDDGYVERDVANDRFGHSRQSSVERFVPVLNLELDRLKTNYIKENLTFYTFVMENDRRKLGRYFSDCCFDLIKLKEEFPNYFDMIAYKLEVSQKWNTVLDKIMKCPLSSTTCSGKKVVLPFDCLEYIISFLTNVELENLSLAVG